MRATIRVAMAFTLVSGPLHAQMHPLAGSNDPRIQTIDYDPGQIIQLQGTPGYQLTIELSSDEQVQNVAVGDSGAWQVSVNRAGDHLFIKPTTSDAATNMTVITSVRVYNFELLPLPAPSPNMPWNVRFRYPAAVEEQASTDYVDISPILRRMSRYRISGDRLLRPSSVTDDGKHTFVRWPSNSPLPAVYVIAANGQERLANGGVRGDDYVIDSVSSRLVFRIDRQVARADRLSPEKKRHK